MHLMSQNGPIDVLVCPDEDDNCTPQPPCSNVIDEEQLDAASTASNAIVPGTDGPESYLDISLSSMASHDNDLDALLPSFPHLGDQNHFLPGDMFECLSPPLDECDFPYASLSNSEGILDLFDLAS